METVKIIECPRDAMQGMKDFIPTELKVRYLNQLLKVGFDTLDFGSFVSPKAIPQMRDTHSVLAQLDIEDTKTKLLSIIVNERGANQACDYDEIDYLGYPFSISETFQKRNSNKGIEESLELVERLLNICEVYGKELVVYASMAFGNPYGDPYDIAILEHWVDRLESMGVKIISLSDTVGVADIKQISKVFEDFSYAFPKIEIGAHLHTTPETWEEKVNAAFMAGCRRFDGAIKGFGGCPMAKDELVGNMPTEKMIHFLENRNIDLKLDMDEFRAAMKTAVTVF